jgi:hypothetical protein
VNAEAEDFPGHPREKLGRGVELIRHPRDDRPVALRFLRDGDEAEGRALALLRSRFPGAILGECMGTEGGQEAWGVTLAEQLQAVIAGEPAYLGTQGIALLDGRGPVREGHAARPLPPRGRPGLLHEPESLFWYLANAEESPSQEEIEASFPDAKIEDFQAAGARARELAERIGAYVAQIQKARTVGS